MMLIDKGYFDYDFEKTERPKEEIIKSDDEVRDILTNTFGFKHLQKKQETTEELQELIIKDMEEK